MQKSATLCGNQMSFDALRIHSINYGDTTLWEGLLTLHREETNGLGLPSLSFVTLIDAMFGSGLHYLTISK